MPGTPPRTVATRRSTHDWNGMSRPFGGRIAAAQTVAWRMIDA